MSDKTEADTNAEGGDLSADTKPPFNAKKIILIALPILLLAGGGAAAYFMGYIGPKKTDCATVKPEDPEYETCAAEAAAAEQASGPGTFIDIPDMIVNLSSTARQPRFLKIKLKVELEDPTTQKTFETVMPRVVDQFQTYLRELRVDDLKGSSGMYRMKIELLSRVRAAAPDVAVRDVLFQEILIQ